MKNNKYNQILGELEAGIVEIIWKINKASVRDVLNELSKKRKIAYTTVMTVMNRLFEKGILRRRLNDDGSYLYTPAQDKNTFLACNSKKAINNLIKEFGEIAVAQFLDVIETSNLRNLEKWRRKLKRIK